MSDEPKDPAVEPKEPAALPEDVQSKLEELERLKAHHNRLLDETKTAKQKAQELEEAQRKADEDRQKEKGEFKNLYEKTLADLEQEREQARHFRQSIQQKEVESSAYKLAGQLTKDTKRAELLAKEARQFAQHTDDGVKYVVGGMEIEPDKLIEKLREDYPFLVDGVDSSGGGATGSRGGASTKGKVDGDKAERAAYFAQKFKL